MEALDDDFNPVEEDFEVRFICILHYEKSHSQISDNPIPDSQKSAELPSSGSVFNPSQSSTSSSDTIGKPLDLSQQI